MCDDERPADDDWPEGRIVEAYRRGDYGILDRLGKPEPEPPEPHDPGD